MSAKGTCAIEELARDSELARDASRVRIAGGEALNVGSTVAVAHRVTPSACTVDEPRTVLVVAQALWSSAVGFPADSLQTLLADLAAFARHTITTAMDRAPEFVVHWHLPNSNKRLSTCLGTNHTTCTQQQPDLGKNVEPDHRVAD
jgi:hypothetical protein